MIERADIAIGLGHFQSTAGEDAIEDDVGSLETHPIADDSRSLGRPQAVR